MPDLSGWHVDLYLIFESTVPKLEGALSDRGHVNASALAPVGAVTCIIQ